MSASTATPSPIRFSRAICGDLGQAERREWWLANGLGAYGAGTIAGSLTRRYHGLLIAPIASPLGRRLILAKADATLIDGEQSWPLFTNRWKSGDVAPAGHVRIASFHLDHSVPVWSYEIDDRQIEARIWMEPGSHTIYAAWLLRPGIDPQKNAPSLRITLLANDRDHNGQTSVGGFNPDIHAAGDRLVMTDAGRFSLSIRAPGGNIAAKGDWYQDFDLPIESERGLDSTDSHLCVGEATIPLIAGQWCGIVASLDPEPSTDLAGALRRRVDHDRAIIAAAMASSPAMRSAPDWIARLALAADAFVFARPLPSVPDGQSVIAGYPWFGDWGRDTMISLPGLTLATGRADTAARILKTFASFVSQGMLPNVFPGAGDHPDYNTADASLWFFEAWRAYVDATADVAALREAFPVLADMIAWHQKGTRYGIGVDAADGLLKAGAPGVQLTWMDAKVGDWVVTPRIGKPVEINALWYNALCIMAAFAKRLAEPDTYSAPAETAKQSFGRFGRPDGEGLYDVIDGPDGNDASIRPNQIFAVSLPHSPLAANDQARVVAVCRRHLMTAFGLRSLAPGSSAYHSHYGGGVWERDGGYHQGPVWGWLLGPFCLAVYRATGDLKAAQTALELMSDALKDQAVGSIGEIFDGDPPHHPRGAPVQAWSVACTLDAWRQLSAAAQVNRTSTSTKPPDGNQSDMPQQLDAEKRRIEELHSGEKNWRHWGPYLSERQWGTVREDYSPGGTAWDYFSHDHARSRAYRWGEDGIAGFCDQQQQLCLSIALWNGKDPILKERLYGLTNGEGCHGEDVKELYYYLDAVPSNAYARMLYKLPQAAFPYQWLIDENARRRGSAAMEFELIDTGLFDDDRYFDVEVEYAKAGPDDLLMRVTIHNRGPEAATIHALPQAWFRNEWSWEADSKKPSLKDQGNGVVLAEHAELGQLNLRFNQPDRLLFCDNETNFARLYGGQRAPGYFKDAFHDYVVHQWDRAVNPAGEGTKVAGLYVLEIPARGSTTICVRISADQPSPSDFAEFDAVFSARITEADAFYAALQKGIPDEEMRHIQRQAFAGMLWSKQYYYFNVEQWLDGDPTQPAPPEGRKHGRNGEWRHFVAADIISMPDKWEYPWFAAWDLAFHCVTLSLIDPDGAKKQLLLLCEVRLMHPNGSLPAYEWAFGDVNPPVHAWAAMHVFQNDRDRRGGVGDTAFLERIFQKLLLNFTWWVNRKDPTGLNIFEGGFLGLDNIGVFDRSQPLPTGGSIEQSDGTAWMAMFCLNMLRIAIELTNSDPVYEDMALKFLEHFLYIARAMTDMGKQGMGLWDDEDKFFYDILNMPSGDKIPMRLRSMVGLIPLFAVGIMRQEVIDKLPTFWARIEEYRERRPDLVAQVSHWNEEGVERRRLFALARATRMRDILRRLLDETEFLSPYGIRSLSRSYLDTPYEFDYNGAQYGVRYLPGESDGGLFGGNSNWRGPIWMPVNYLLVENLRRFHSYYGEGLTIECPTGSGIMLTLDKIADELCRRLVKLFARGADGRRPVFGQCEKFQTDPHFKDHILFQEYFHGDNGRGCGASHQTGWTGLIANLIDQLALEGPPPEPANETGEILEAAAKTAAPPLSA